MLKYAKENDRMKKRKLLALFLAAMMLVALLTACVGEAPQTGLGTPAAQPGSQPAQPAPPPSPPAEDPADDPMDEPEPEPEPPTERLIIDQLGREVVVPYVVTSIATAHNPSQSMAAAIGGVDVVATGRGGNSIFDLIAPHIADLPTVTGGGGAGAFNLEVLGELLPDVFIFPSGRYDTTVPYMDMFDIPAVAIHPQCVDSILETVEILGAVFNRQEHAAAVAEAFQGHINVVAERLVGAEHTPTAVVLGNSVSSVHSNGQLQAEIIVMAGAENVAADVEGRSHVDVGLEQMLAWDPEYIFITAWGGAISVDEVLAEERFAHLQAIQNGNVFRFPSPNDWWDTASICSGLAVMWAAHIMHPDLISDEELETAVLEFYYLLYGMEISREFLGF